MENKYAAFYGKDEKRIMKISEDSLNPKLDRIHEIIEFAKEAGIKTIGIANCITFDREAKALEDLLLLKGFQVVRANCKLGKLPSNDILPGYKGISCNPAGQASELAKAKTEMNIVMGLCLGHDMVFTMNSKAPTTTLLVKDRKHQHNPYQGFKS